MVVFHSTVILQLRAEAILGVYLYLLRVNEPYPNHSREIVHFPDAVTILFDQERLLTGQLQDLDIQRKEHLGLPSRHHKLHLPALRLQLSFVQLLSQPQQPPLQTRILRRRHAIRHLRSGRVCFVDLQHHSNIRRH